MTLDDTDIAARFMSKVDRSGDCHLWMAARHPKGHGIFWLPKPDDKLVYAHRLMLEQKLGRPLEPGELATHACDNPPCVNPDHLEPGSQLKNMHDAASRRRLMHGTGHYATRLTEQDVREIIALLSVPGVTQQGIAERYRVSRSAIGLIKSGRNWKHISRRETPGRLTPTPHDRDVV